MTWIRIELYLYMISTKPYNIMLQAINKKHQSKVNRAINWLIKYSENNALRDMASDNEDDWEYRRYDRICIKAFDKYLEIVSELPSREVKQIESSKYY